MNDAEKKKNRTKNNKGDINHLFTQNLVSRQIAMEAWQAMQLGPLWSSRNLASLVAFWSYGNFESAIGYLEP